MVHPADPVDAVEGAPMNFAPTADTDLHTWCQAAIATPMLQPDEEAQLRHLIEMGDSESHD
jgi:hypothetical protein